MKKTVIIMGIFLAGTAAAQDQFQWVNANLQRRQMPQEQYVAIGKGHFAQCQASATREARAATSERVNSCNWNAMPMVCAAQRGQAESDGEELLQSLFVGCMAEKGWLWTKVR